MFKLGFLSFLVGFILVGAACTPAKMNTTNQSPAPTISSMRNPDESKASESLPLSTGTDADSLQKDLDNTDVSSLSTMPTDVQNELK